MTTKVRLLLTVLLVASLAGCGNSGLFKNLRGNGKPPDTRTAVERGQGKSSGKIWDLFSNKDNPNVTINVNKYIWDASLDVLSFLPIKAADPFSGVIVTGWGHAKGASRQYRATIYIQDPALDARSLRVAVETRSGPADMGTVRAIENAILTRARQMRIADGKL